MLVRKNIKVHLGLSEETYAYTATVYWHGKKAVEVSNQGHGGCDSQHAVGSVTVKHIGEWCKATLPKWKAGGREYDTDLEIWCADQVSRHLKFQDMKRALRARPLFIKPGEKGVFDLRFKGIKKYDERMATIVTERHPGATVLNTLPLDDALALYLEFA